MSSSNENIMQFWPLPNIVGKIYVDSSDSEDSEIEVEEPLIKNWSQSCINQSQSAVSFKNVEKKEVQEEKENLINHNDFCDEPKDSSPIKQKSTTQIRNNYSYSNSNYNNDSSCFQCKNTEKHERSVEFIFGKKIQPDISNIENKESSNKEVLKHNDPETSIVSNKICIDSNKLPKLVITTKNEEDQPQCDTEQENCHCKSMNAQSKEFKHDVIVEKNYYIKHLPQLIINKNPN